MKEPCVINELCFLRLKGLRAGYVPCVTGRLKSLAARLFIIQLISCPAAGCARMRCRTSRGSRVVSRILGFCRKCPTSWNPWRWRRCDKAGSCGTVRRQLHTFSFLFSYVFLPNVLFNSKGRKEYHANVMDVITTVSYYNTPWCIGPHLFCFGATFSLANRYLNLRRRLAHWRHGYDNLQGFHWSSSHQPGHLVLANDNDIFTEIDWRFANQSQPTQKALQGTCGASKITKIHFIDLWWLLGTLVKALRSGEKKSFTLLSRHEVILLWPLVIFNKHLPYLPTFTRDSINRLKWYVFLFFLYTSL